MLYVLNKHLVNLFSIRLHISVMCHCNIIYTFQYLFSALEKLREEFKADSESLVHSEAISILSLCDE